MTYWLLLGQLFLVATADIPERMDVKLSSGTHPSVFLTAVEQEAARSRVQTHQWAAVIAQNLEKAADALAAKPMDIPKTGGQWTHWYTCKKDGGSLHAESPTRHVCEVCKEVYSGFPYNECHITNQHNYWLRGVEQLGLAYAVNPKPVYAERIHDILLTYASFYQDLPNHDRHREDTKIGARIFAQTLNEAVALCSMAFGYDLVYDAPCFSDDDHDVIAEKLFRPMVDTIMQYRAGNNNWQSWHNAAIASAGFVLRDSGMVDIAINDKDNGFLFQMKTSVLPSGMWYEGAPSYHWYALSAHVYLLEAAARSGMDLYSLPVVKSLFTGPTVPLFPDLTYPAINDSSRSSISDVRRFYEIAYRRYGESKFLSLCEPRDNWQTLLWGRQPDENTVAAELELKSSNDKEGGLAILRDPKRDAAIFMNYSPEPGGHTHQARLDILLYAFGDERIVDPGRLPYGNPFHWEWYSQTVAHNTVVVNETTQANSPGKFKAFRVADDWAMARASLDTAYKGVELDRTVFLYDGVIIDVFQCQAKQNMTFDLPLHFNGSLLDMPEGIDMELSKTNGYQHLHNLQKIEGSVHAFKVDTGNDTAIHVSFLDRSTLYRAEGRAQPATRFIPIVMRRHVGKTAIFATVYQLLAQGETPRTIQSNLAETIHITVGKVTLLVGNSRTSVTVDDTHWTID